MRYSRQAQPAAFAMLYHRYFERIHAYLRSRTGDAEDAADLTQQVFLQALDALPRYRHGRVPFAAWLFRIAHNVAIDHHRRRRHAHPGQHRRHAQRDARVSATRHARPHP